MNYTSTMNFSAIVLHISLLKNAADGRKQAVKYIIKEENH